MKTTTTTTIVTETTTTTTTANDPVEIIVILDRSGSMHGSEDDVIKGFNGFVKEQQAEAGEAVLTLIQFDSLYEVVYDNVDIQQVPELTSDVYFPRGATAMYDAIGQALSTSTSEKAMVLIQTDGYENASREYNGAQIREMIKGKEAQGWDFIFLGADINVEQEASKFGMAANKSMAFAKSADGIASAYNSMSTSTSLYRSSVSNTDV